jgi:hypothetical protein
MARASLRDLFAHNVVQERDYQNLAFVATMSSKSDAVSKFSGIA